MSQVLGLTKEMGTKFKTQKSQQFLLVYSVHLELSLNLQFSISEPGILRSGDTAIIIPDCGVMEIQLDQLLCGLYLTSLKLQHLEVLVYLSAASP